LWLGIVLAGSGLAAGSALAADDYRFDITVDFSAPQTVQGCVAVSLRVKQTARSLRRLRWPIDARFAALAGDGLTLDGQWVTWNVPAGGGRLRYCAQLNQTAGNGRYTSRLTTDWAVFRGDDLVPAARTVTAKGARSITTLRFVLPQAWSVVTRYRQAAANGRIQIDNPRRRFDRPTGWMTAGELGVRRERLGAVQVTVAGPRDHGLRRMDLIAMLGYHLPMLSEKFGGFPERLLVVGADEKMWYGGLSGPASLFINAELPLISENGTSVLLHELVHIALGRSAAPSADWIVEGLAEYVGLDLLRTSGGITERRFEHSVQALARWGAKAERLDVERATGAVTARAATLFAALHRELGDADFERFLERLASGHGPLAPPEVAHAAATVLGHPSQTLAGLEATQVQTKD